ncbi:ATP-dependent RecD-like DNA helicase [Streptococcaceae bacterium ESL0687]|nr:ATP-dependent RecD-like DNA helicase [Streptococcaceae bacterium ESL0687]
MMDKIFFTGSIEAVFFENPSNFYKVLLIDITDTNSDYLGTEIVVNGTIGDLIEGETYTFFGHLTNHPKYGEQLKVTSYEKEAPSDSRGLINYLSSEHFPGIGKKTAEKILASYPEDTIDSILNDSSKLDPILSPAKKTSLLRRLSENHGMEKILAKLSEYGLSSKINFQIYDFYKEETLDVISQNPYQLVEDIKGVGFKTADRMAESLGIEANSRARYRAGLLHLIFESAQETGNTYIEAKELLDRTVSLLEDSRNVEVLYDDLAQTILELVEDGKIQQEGTKLFENSLFFAEAGIAKNIEKLLSRKSEKIQTRELDRVIGEVEEEFSISYDSLQKTAIKDALDNQFFILTGGPGTGKTTVLNGIIHTFARINDLDLDPASYDEEVFPILLGAPTGRAARRMNELTGLPSATLHRHLRIGTDEDNNLDESPDELSGRLLIVDEFSMVDTWLANRLFDSIPPGMKVIIVGDADQLPSVGPGQVLADLLRIAELPSVKLERIFRQDENSTITSLAHSIKDGKLPADFRERKADGSYFEAFGNQIPEIIRQIAVSWKNKGNNPFEFQVLIPMYKGVAGIININTILQDIFNPLEGGLQFDFQDKVFRRGDKILHLVNETSLNVFNGDLGHIIDLIPAKDSESKQDEILMNFDGSEISYPRSEWYKITLAYAMSIHKSQGSEFATVLVPMISSYNRMLERNLLYTAITRAKKSLILTGEYQAFNQAVRKVGCNRKTYLLEQFKGLEGNGKSSKSTESVSDQAIFEFSESSLSSETSSESSFEVREDVSSFIDQEPEELILSQELIEGNKISPMIGIGQEDLKIFSKN